MDQELEFIMGKLAISSFYWFVVATKVAKIGILMLIQIIYGKIAEKPHVGRNKHKCL